MLFAFCFMRQVMACSRISVEESCKCYT